MIDSASILDLFADRHGDRLAAGRDGMAAYLKCLLAESAGHLARAGAGARLPTARREAVATLIHDVCHLRDGMTRPAHPPLDDALRAGAGLPAITRATLDDLERAGLSGACRPVRGVPRPLRHPGRPAGGPGAGRCRPGGAVRRGAGAGPRPRFLN
jgi:hypothetical protein